MPPSHPITIDHARAIPWPNEDTHKHNRGRLAVVAGGQFQTGAARLAARAGQRIGAGWVSLFGSHAACDVMAFHETSILICERDPTSSLSHQLGKSDAAIIGPALGLNDASRDDVLDLIEGYQGALVLDADALTHIGQSKSTAFDVLKSRSTSTILTPHAGEFTTLFGAFDPSNKIAATVDEARQLQCFIVHKGSATILATPSGQVFTCMSEAPFLATAGTGDVLAGIIGGLLAQGMAGIDACKAAIWVHSEAGRRCGAGLIAEDLITILPTIVGDLYFK